MTEKFETEIRKALDAKAHEVALPADLAARTMQTAATVDVRQPLADRVRTWRDSRRMNLPASGYPRWLLAPAAACAALVLFGVGAYVGRPREEPLRIRAEDRPSAANQRGSSESSDAVSGEVTGVVSAGDASVDSTNRRQDVDVETGDASGSNSASSFLRPTAGSDPAALEDVSNSAAREPQLVRAADIRVAVRNFESSWAKANEIAAVHNGFVIDSKTKQVNDRIATGTVRMRVPSTELEAVLKDLRELGTLARLDTSGDDISKQMADVQERVDEASDKEKELKDLEARARTVSESLSIRNRLEDVRSDIKNLEKKQKAYRDQVDMSIVNATIFQDEVAAGRGAGILGNAFETSGRLFLTILAGALVVAAALAPLALLALAIWLAVRTYRNRGRDRGRRRRAT